MATTIIFNACIITMNERMELIKNGSIRIEGNQIKEIREDKIESPDAEYFDAEGMIVMPGFINTHTHVPMTMLRGYADDLPLHTWLNEHIFPAEARMVTPENVAIASRFAFIEMIKSGTTCFNDMYFFEDIIASEAKKAGIRAIVGESLIDFPTPSFHTVDEGMARCESLVQQWYGDSLIHPAICAHSPYTCSKETLQKAKVLSEKYNIPLHIHVAETRKPLLDRVIGQERDCSPFRLANPQRDRIVRTDPDISSPLSEKQSKTGQRDCRHGHLPESRCQRKHRY